ncbi:glycine betaine ABC transporter substrate-binding protein [Nocardia vermiculata]|uniref:Transporter n=1 Tax=Nocardia vermiculata TaxID=257274 RepID=A0A846XTH8_9NOCA|nr:glycine betaine ABC transporter substrate-binding protein [Nocardia vermiculata]NKY49074.1 transporter [Nocardia vermiculata]
MRLAGSVRATARAVLVVSVVAVVAACASGPGAPTITVGAGDSVQSEVLAEIYAQALARSGTSAVTRKHLGKRADYLAALDAGTITVVADTSGDLLTTFDSSSAATAPDQDTATAVAQQRTTASGPAAASPAGAAAGPDVVSVADDLSRSVPAGLAVSDIADGIDLRPQFALSPAAATRYPADLAHLGPECAQLSVGIATGHELDPLRTPPDPRRDVLTPLREVYGCDITRHTEFDSDVQLRQALLDGRVDAGVFTSAVGLLPGGAGDLVVAGDPEYAFRARNVIPLLRQGELDQQQLKKLNYVAGELTTAEFTEIVRSVRDEHASAADLARGWLDAHSL